MADIGCPPIIMTLEEKLSQKVAEINGGDNGESALDVVEQKLNPAKDDQKQPVNVVPEFAVSLDQARERIQMLQQFVKQYMVVNEDYGLISGCQRPSLFKPGAEKLCDVYGFSKHVEVTGRVEDWDKPFLHYEVKITLVNKRTGYVEAEGIGNANSREKKFTKQDTYSIANTLLKIAKKRALVDAVLSATRSSGLFTQDIEDMVVMGIGPEKEEIQPFQETPKCAEEPVQNNNSKATEEQLKQIYALAKELGLSTNVGKQIMKSQFSVENSRNLTKAQADSFISKLLELKRDTKK